MTHASIAVKPVKIRRIKNIKFFSVMKIYKENHGSMAKNFFNIFKGSNKPSALGIFVVMVLKMLTRTRNMVIRSVIRPGTTSGGIRNEIQDTMTNIPEGR